MAVGSVLKANNWRNPLMAGWTHNYNIYIQKANAGSDTLMVLSTGNSAEQKKFRKSAGDTVYRSMKGDARSLRRTGDRWMLYSPDGSRWHFNANGQIDTIFESDGTSLTLEYSGTDSTLTRVKDIRNNSIEFRYNNSRLTRAFTSLDSLYFFEYRYAATNACTALCQVLYHANTTTSDSLVATGRYYYDTPLAAMLMNTYSLPKGSQAQDTNWATSRNKEERLNCWFHTLPDTVGINRGNPCVYQELVGDSSSGNIVLYRAYFRFFYDTTTALRYPDSTQTWYYEDTTSFTAHNPTDTLFSPADSLPSAFGTKYYVYTIAYDTNGTKKYERHYDPATGDSSKITYASYDKNYHPWAVTDPNGGVTNYTYGTYQDPYNPDSTRYMDSPSKVKYPNGDSVMTYLSVKGGVNRILPDSARDELGNRTWHYYDVSKDYLDTAVVYKSRQLADGDTNHHDVTTRYHYSSKYGNLIETLDPLGHKTRMYYAPGDTGSHLTQQRVVMSSDTGATDIVTKYGYNTATGTLDTMTFYRDYPGNPSNTYYYYDQFNRAVKTVYPDTAKDSTVYDLRGNVLKRYTIKTDTLSKTEYEYSPRDLVTKTKEYRQPKDTPAVYDSTLYYYNLHDRLIKQVNQLGKATNYTYVMDRLLKIAYPDTTNDSLGYYADGSLKFKRDRKGQVIEYMYDGTSAGCGCPSESRYRLVSKRYYDTWAQYTGTPKIPTDTVHYDYDAVGNRVKMVDKLGTTQYTYDGLYRLQTDSCGYLNTKVMYQYDQAGNRTRMKVCSGDTSSVYLDQTYTSYDNANRAGTTAAGGQEYSFSYWDTGMPNSIQYYNDGESRVTEYYYLTNRGFVDSMRTAYWIDAPLTTYWFKNKYSYNGLGDRTSQYVYLSRPGTSALTGTISYTYDGLRRLTKVKNPAGFNGGDSIRYVYDKAGNRTRKYRGASGTDQINIYRQSDNELLYRDKIPYLEDQYAYEYDANGNLTQSFDEPGTRTYAYDFENRLTKVKQGSDSTVFFYNGVGVRLKKLGTKDSSIQYIPDGMYIAVERRTNGNLRYKYVYANGLLLARIDSAGTTYYYSHDALGSIVGASSNTAVYKSFLYDEFGDSLGAWGATSINNYRYTGQEYDITPVNAYNLRAREYYPKLGRFMQNDQIGDKGGSPNWYLYVANNPINATDPSGEKIRQCYVIRGAAPHSYLEVNGVGWGFYAVSTASRWQILQGHNVPAEVVYDHGGICRTIVDDDCKDKCVNSAILQSIGAPGEYNLYKRNCYHWIGEILNQCK